MDELEEWNLVDGFPDYIVSNHGRIKNIHTDRVMSLSPIQTEMLTVGLMHNGLQYRRSVAGIVARAFLEPPPRDDFTTPIHLDGDKKNCMASNLAWRPRWFAINYHMERKNPPFPDWDQDIRLMDNLELFANPSEAAVKYGLLERDIHRSLVNGVQVFPWGFVFAFDEIS